MPDQQDIHDIVAQIPTKANGSRPVVVTFLTAGPHAAAADILEEAGCDVRRVPAQEKAWNEALITEYVEHADALLGTFSSLGLPRAVLERAARTRIVTSAIIGTESIDVEAATDLGIVVAHGAVAENFDGMAEAGVMLIAALIKDLPGKLAAFSEARWRPVAPGHMVTGATIGIVGLGRIGQSMARRLTGWDCTIIAADPYLDPKVAEHLGVELVTMGALLARSDVVLPLVTLSDETRNLIDRNALRNMKRGAFLINIGRGGCVDEHALIEALNDGHIAGAALDTWATEPLPADHPLRHHPKVIGTGHVVGHSEELYARLPTAAAENVLLGLAGKDPLHIRNPEVLPAWRERFRQLCAA